MGGNDMRPCIPKRFWVFAAFLSLLTLCFAPVLIPLTRYALDEELLSHIPLMPCIAAYLVFGMRRRALGTVYRGSPGMSAVFLLAGIALLAFRFWLKRIGMPPAINDGFSLLMGAFLCLLYSGVIGILGMGVFRVALFPLAMLLFAIPIPLAAVHALEIFFQVTSAWTFGVIFRLTGIPFIQEGVRFTMPKLVMEVGTECSGIRSSLVLLITGLLAGDAFIRSRGKRVALALSFLPIGILRNAVRILTLAVLSDRYGPQALQWWIHRKGGPVFFVFSLIPLFALALWLKRTERRAAALKIPNDSVFGNMSPTDKTTVT